jgi:hypothetical protein
MPSAVIVALLGRRSRVRFTLAGDEPLAAHAVRTRWLSPRPRWLSTAEARDYWLAVDSCLTQAQRLRDREELDHPTVPMALIG